jgi:CheY-like chemotaxis protein
VLAHHLFEIAVADAVAAIPSHRPEHDLTFKMASLEVRHRLPPPRSDPSSRRAHVFATEPAGRTLGRAEGGLGIGLSLVQRIAKLHGGEVEAHSEGEGRGSRFVIRLPLSENTETDALPAPEAAAPRVAASSRRVLVVDDTPDVANSLALLLETLGAQVRVAYGGGEALLACAEFEPEFIFLDLSMPEIRNGAAHARSACRASPMLVALSGWSEGETRRRIEEAGFDRHLTKPADLSELEQLLETARLKDPGKGDVEPQCPAISVDPKIVDEPGK